MLKPFVLFLLGFWFGASMTIFVDFVSLRVATGVWQYPAWVAQLNRK